MDNLSGRQYQDALLKIGMLCELRRRNVPEEEMAVKLQFGSIEAMHVQFANWDLPDWITGSASGNTEPDKPQRHARTAREEPIELPLAYDALPLFHKALKKLNRAIGDLENRKEYLQNGRFVAQEATGPVNWPDMGIENETLTVPLGGQHTPLEPLPPLIAAYFLADEPLEPLLETLNRWPESVHKEQIQALIEGGKDSKGHTRGLKSIAGMIARGIRGGAIRPGPTTGEVSARIQNGAWYSRQLSERKLAPAMISERLREAGFTRGEISQIQSLKRLPQPE
jgi:hypothetical protein